MTLLRQLFDTLRQFCIAVVNMLPSLNQIGLEEPFAFMEEAFALLEEEDGLELGIRQEQEHLDAGVGQAQANAMEYEMENLIGYDPAKKGAVGGVLEQEDLLHNIEDYGWDDILNVVGNDGQWNNDEMELKLELELDLDLEENSEIFEVDVELEDNNENGEFPPLPTDFFEGL